VLNSDGQQFHQYQQNKQPHLSPQIIEHKKRQHMVLESHILDWDSHKNVVGLNQLMESPSLPL
jgi:hypothetical protein